MNIIYFMNNEDEDTSNLLKPINESGKDSLIDGTLTVEDLDKMECKENLKIVGYCQPIKNLIIKTIYSVRFSF